MLTAKHTSGRAMASPYGTSLSSALNTLDIMWQPKWMVSQMSLVLTSLTSVNVTILETHHPAYVPHFPYQTPRPKYATSLATIIMEPGDV